MILLLIVLIMDYYLLIKNSNCTMIFYIIYFCFYRIFIFVKLFLIMILSKSQEDILDEQVISHFEIFIKLIFIFKINVKSNYL